MHSGFTFVRTDEAECPHSCGTGNKHQQDTLRGRPKQFWPRKRVMGRQPTAQTGYGACDKQPCNRRAPFGKCPRSEGVSCLKYRYHTPPAFATLTSLHKLPHLLRD